MPDSENIYLQRGSMIAERAAELAKTRRGRRIGIAVLVLLLIFTIGGFLVVPHVLRRILTGQVATSLHRPVSVGTIRFNPYTLRLQVNDLLVGSHGNEKPLAGFAHLDLKAGWSSFFRIKPIVKEFTLDKPAINVVRNADGTFNFSDLLAPSAEPSPQAPSKPLKFSVANIRINDGDVTFDDEKVGSHHEIKQLELDVPFIANLPGKIDYVVQPLLKMVVDGTLIAVQGASRPFAGTRDSAFTLTFHRIDLPQFISYLPPSMALKLPSGALSVDMLLHFRQADTGPTIVLNGAVAVDQLDMRDSSNTPVLALDHGEVKVDQLGPLDHVAYLSEIALMGLKANVVRNQDRTLNVVTMFATPPARKVVVTAAQEVATTTRKVQAAAAPAPAAQAAQRQQESSPYDVAVDSIKVMNSAASYTDLSAGSPANVALDGLNAQVKHLRLSGQLPADYQLAANVHTGGTVTLKGTLQLPKSDATGEVALDQVDLPSLQAFAQSVFAGTLSSGKLSAHGTLQTHFASDQFNLHAEPADLAIDSLAIQEPRMKDPPVAWTHFGVTLDKFDLASRQVAVKEVRSDGIKLFFQRSKDGHLSLTELMKKTEPPRTESHRSESARTEREERSVAKPAAEPPAPPWHYQVQSIALEKTDARFVDYATPKVVRAQFAPLNIHLKDVTNDFAKPFGVQVDGVRNRRGTFKIDGNAAIDPLSTELSVETKNLDLSAINNYVSTKLNAQLTSAELTMNAHAGVQEVKKDYHVKYRGDLALTNFAAIDKATGDNFVDWKSLSLRDVDAAIGEGAPKVHVRSIALANFDARVILNSAGKLNLSDIVAQPNAAPKSLTREELQEGEVLPGAKAPVPTATPAPGAAATAAAQPMNADLMVDKVTLEGGHVDYTDDFIKPNYSANLTDITGSIGAFGTKTQQPADVELQGQVNGSAPLNISGSVNPLTPLAFVDLKANAKGIELTPLSAYSTKYTGYPIIKGSLNVDVHYLLDQGKLTANNHIFLDQLTFGDRVENSTARNLPVRFAVAVLKNSRGEINLNIPVSGSLSDPQFSLGSVIWGAFLNVITKAVTAPFTLLASAIGGIAGGGGGSGDTATQDLSYVAFTPGLATLDENAKNGLTTLGNALRDRPTLRLSICGRVDPDKDLDGLREAWVNDQIRAAKARDIGRDPQTVQVTQGDYDRYLERAYYKAKIPKPRNVVGLAKEVPRDQMKKLMIENAPVSKDDLPKLADGRAAAVHQYLIATIPADRLSVVAPKLNADGITSGATTRADLSMALK
ncbi:MAG: DUF748 domain-containing protein [Deltaproteobacteria bacterium]|nr:DUF748 domain-containing protein [Deltaproteobacteria bacterium]